MDHPLEVRSVLGQNKGKIISELLTKALEQVENFIALHCKSKTLIIHFILIITI